MPTEKTQEEIERERLTAEDVTNQDGGNVETAEDALSAEGFQDVEDVGDQDDAGQDDLAARQEGIDDEPPQRGRAERRIQALQEQARAAQEKADRLEREMAQERAERQRTQAQRTEAEERDALALMTAEERMEYRLNKAQKETQNLVAQMQFQTQEAADRAAFQAMAATNPVAARYAEEVEGRLQALRAQGGNIAREQMLRWIIGDKQLAGAGKARSRAEAQGQRRIERQQVRPGSGKGDQAGGRRRQEPSLEERLSDVTF
jgi:hypothetical protein